MTLFFRNNDTCTALQVQAIQSRHGEVRKDKVTPIGQYFSTISQGRCWTHKNETFLLGLIKLTFTVADFKSHTFIYLLVYLTALSVPHNCSFE
jgi:hypothetical protein